MAEALARDDLAAVGAAGPSLANVAHGQDAGQDAPIASANGPASRTAGAAHMPGPAARRTPSPVLRAKSLKASSSASSPGSAPSLRCGRRDGWDADPLGDASRAIN